MGYHGSGATGHPFVGETLIPPSSFTIENFPMEPQTQVVAINNNGATAGFLRRQRRGQPRLHQDQRQVRHRGFPEPELCVDADSQHQRTERSGRLLAEWRRQLPFTEKAGVFTSLDTKLPSNTSAQATGVNNEGDICGFYVDSSGVNHGFLNPAHRGSHPARLRGRNSDAGIRLEQPSAGSRHLQRCQGQHARFPL